MVWWSMGVDTSWIFRSMICVHFWCMYIYIIYNITISCSLKHFDVSMMYHFLHFYFSQFEWQKEIGQNHWFLLISFSFYPPFFPSDARLLSGIRSWARGVVSTHRRWPPIPVGADVGGHWMFFWGVKVSLVGGLEHFLFFHILGIWLSQLTFIFSRGVQTTNQVSFWGCFIWVPSGKHTKTMEISTIL